MLGVNWKLRMQEMRPLAAPILVVAVSALASIAAFQFVGSPWHVSIGAAAGILLAAILPGSGQTAREADRQASEAA